MQSVFANELIYMATRPGISHWFDYSKTDYWCGMCHGFSHSTTLFTSPLHGMLWCIQHRPTINNNYCFEIQSTTKKKNNCCQCVAQDSITLKINKCHCTLNYQKTYKITNRALLGHFLNNNNCRTFMHHSVQQTTIRPTEKMYITHLYSHDM